MKEQPAGLLSLIETVVQAQQAPAGIQGTCNIGTKGWTVPGCVESRLALYVGKDHIEK